MHTCLEDSFQYAEDGLDSDIVIHKYLERILRFCCFFFYAVQIQEIKNNYCFLMDLIYFYQVCVFKLSTYKVK